MTEKIKVIVAGVGTMGNYLLGGFDDALIFLIIVMCIDYMTGIVKSYIKNQISSQVGFIGIVKKIFIIFILIIAVQLDRLTGTQEPLFRTMVCWFFISNECISIFENAGAMGVPIPIKLKNALEQLKDKEVNEVEQK